MGAARRQMQGVGRRQLIQRLGTAALAAPYAARSLASGATRPVDRPNIVVIVADDLGYGEVSCYPQQRRIRTPNIDRVAATGVRLTDGYAADGMCWPSRGSILTGRYHQRWGSRAAVPETERMIGGYLKPAGYVTGCVGKWHNTASIGTWDGEQKNHPFGRGFDEFFGFLGGMHDYFDAGLGTHWIRGKNRPYPMPVYDGTRPVEEVRYLTDEFSDRAVDFISRHKDERFFLYLAYTAKHTPLQAPAKYLERNDGDVNAAMIDAMDVGVGRVLDTLEQHGLRENTMVWFVGDNGGWPDSNWSLRGRKGTFFEGGLRVPFLVSWPRRLSERRVCSDPAMHIDMLPSILAAAGVRLPADRYIDGVNLLSYLRGSTSGSPHDALFWGRLSGKRRRFAVRRGPWKLVCNAESPNHVAGQQADQIALYNLDNDVAESENLREAEANRADELLGLAERWHTRVAGASHPTPR